MPRIPRENGKQNRMQVKIQGRKGQSIKGRGQLKTHDKEKPIDHK